MQIQIGTGSTNVPSTNAFDSNGMMVLKITFPKPFKEVPSVVCNVQTSRVWVGKQVEASNITTTGFTAYCHAADKGHFGWNWIAIGKQGYIQTKEKQKLTHVPDGIVSITK